jgi:iron-sulfur cluster repair protein YtfE (RIC family)
VLPSEPIRAEHRELLPHLEQLRAVGDAVGRVPGHELRIMVDEAYAFLTEHLVPHAHAEDAVLYPEVARHLGAPRATATMSRDHVEVGRLIADLATLRAGGIGQVDAHRDAELRRVCYGLYALVKTHFAKEEEIYLPLLDERLTTAEFAEVYARMERAAKTAPTAV